ncbi:unnamed protein product [Phytophthora fragariaefolia]|uniref:Unnamed protein product n=1 Tax=Phytophthora fragariaefolia TaxID=1490495 RepID=A0A9W6TM18_9STRA|nr:unnamed protein product [Phytophthora fragariaefolia]
MSKETTLCKPHYRFTCSNIPLTWLPSATAAVQAIQHAFAEAVLLSFLDFDNAFGVYTNVSGAQIGGIIIHDVRILAGYSHSLTKLQIIYATSELELLSIIELPREFRKMLLGFPALVHTDHNNIIS